MQNYTGQVREVLLEAYQNASARLLLPGEALPKPGQYLHAWRPDDPDEVLPTSFFAAGSAEFERRSGQYLLPVSGRLPSSWTPDTALRLRGPLGRWFTLPQRTRRLALVALDRSPGRLLPLLAEALQRGIATTLFIEGHPAQLPLEVELRPFDGLPEGLVWADFLALDLRAEQIEGLVDRLGGAQIPASQAQVLAPMPCGALADCGLCSVETTSGPRLACQDGPVFPLKSLLT